MVDASGNFVIGSLTVSSLSEEHGIEISLENDAFTDSIWITKEEARMLIDFLFKETMQSENNQP